MLRCTISPKKYIYIYNSSPTCTIFNNIIKTFTITKMLLMYLTIGVHLCTCKREIAGC